MKDEQIKSEKESREDWWTFHWEDWGDKMKKHHRKHIMADPYGCDRCGDTYNKNDLIKIQAERVCRNCLCSG